MEIQILDSDAQMLDLDIQIWDLDIQILDLDVQVPDLDVHGPDLDGVSKGLASRLSFDPCGTFSLHFEPHPQTNPWSNQPFSYARTHGNATLRSHRVLC